MAINIIESVIHTSRSQELVSQIIPILVKWAINRQSNKTYGDLLHEIGYTHYTGIGTQLGNVEDVMRELRKITREDIPTLNALVKSSKEGIPAKGFEFVYPNYWKLSLPEKRVFVADINEEVYNYPKWDWVLKELGLKRASLFTEKQLDDIKNLQCNYGGEGTEHKTLKEYICQHPESLGLENVVFAETEHVLPSGDRLDVYFELANNTHIAIEVKPSISPEQDIKRGVFQCVKYHSIMAALRKIECREYDIKVILVAVGNLSSQNILLADELDVTHIVNFKM